MRTPFQTLAMAAAVAGAFAAAAPALAADWKPTRPVEFVVTAGPGGGTDQFARVVQATVQKHKLMPVPIIVTNKGGGAGSEAMVYLQSSQGDANKLVFSTNLAYLMPMITKVGYKIETMTPVAIMAADEFLLWSNAESPYKDAKGFIDAARAKPNGIKMGGAQSKDTDHILTRQIEMTTGVQMTYVPFKSGGEVAAQLSGGHVDANLNNPSENVSHWRAGKVQPLCVFTKERLKIDGKVQGGKGFADVPTCKESGIAIDTFNMPRTVWAAGGLTPEQVKYYENVMAQVREKPEFKEWLARGLQTEMFLTGAKLKDYIAADAAKNKAQFAKDDWLVKD
ncbi:tripartite tricarboxylate transporter substrate binding protein [Pseudorhodoferax sp. Leaf265]|uniref:tripartite tricarboxylate transporter substrate binding protein n=1 Tax=Pseudorhodoferax sp. Leaf265 TaxID=1736315 RepID=UPI0006FD00B6|nr:tripartite tricarboxylate transporter substrate-binding protein [Pseudorhodoferax sp. Leaf265]KQP08864.1 tricarboxylate transporter [Pseudorhodoferax sp. Leaf265]